MFPEFTLRYARLPERFYLRFDPVPVSEPRLVAFNRPLAEQLGFDLAAFDERQAAEWFAGNAVPPGAQPLAQAYAGHQFGHFFFVVPGNFTRIELIKRLPVIIPFTQNGNPT